MEIKKNYTGKNGKFKPGNPGKPKGSTHSSTFVRKVFFNLFKDIEESDEDLFTLYQALENPKDKLTFLTSILRYIVAPFEPVPSNEETEEKEKKVIEFVYSEPNSSN